MESIILLVLFGIVSSVFQAVVKNSKQQKSADAGTQRVKPIVQPMKAQPKKALSRNTQLANETRSNVYIGKDLGMHQEGIATEIVENIVVQEQKEIPSSTPRFTWMDDITFDDLQRSIIMAEVLGKPKALKKAAR